MKTTLADHSLALTAMAAAGDVVYEWDLVSDAISWIGPVEGLFGTPDAGQYATGEAFHGRVNPEDLPFRLKALSDHYVTRETYDWEYRVRQVDGSFCWVHDRGFAEFSREGTPLAMRGVLRLVNRRKQHEERLEHLASFDELTGYFNRSRLREALQEALVHSQRYGLPGAYLSIGIDKLALINDAYGYLTADAVIVAVGQRLERIIRASDTIGRVGGDVYGVVLSHCPEPEAVAIAEKILRVFREHPIFTPTGPIHVSVSIGSVAFATFVQTAGETIARAETALQDAKRQGRDCFRLYQGSEEQRRDHRQSMAIGEQVKEALKDHRLVFAFQPVVGHDGTAAFYECLLRMRSTTGDIIPAGTFVPVVEQLGLSRIMDRRVLELGVEELVRSPDVRLSLNISGFTASDHGWLRSLVALVSGRPEVARRLIVEITETAAIEDIEETARFVATIRELGCRVALDDFGAGYTSFRHLKALTVDIVKIDGSFVRGIATNEDNRLFVRTLVGLAKGFQLATVAECVESAEDAAVLAAEGIDHLQGYHFARPTIDRPWLAGRAVPLRRSRRQSAARRQAQPQRAAQAGL
jgi:diguanylate cyclase (GGDEF)-like protein